MSQPRPERSGGLGCDMPLFQSLETTCLRSKACKAGMSQPRPQLRCGLGCDMPLFQSLETTCLRF